MRILFITAVLGGLLLATSSQSYAEEERAGGAVISRIQPDKLAAILTAAGYPAEVQSDNSGPYVATTMSGFNVTVIPYDCKAQGCSSIQFWTGFSADPSINLEFVNAWNNQWRFAKTSLDAQGNLIFTADMFIDGGVTAENIKVNAGLFDYLLGELNQFSP